MANSCIRRIVLTCLSNSKLVINLDPSVALMRGHLQCRDILAGNEGCPLKTGTTVLVLSSAGSILDIYIEVSRYL